MTFKVVEPKQFISLLHLISFLYQHSDLCLATQFSITSLSSVKERGTLLFDFCY